MTLNLQQQVLQLHSILVPLHYSTGTEIEQYNHEHTM